MTRIIFLYIALFAAINLSAQDITITVEGATPSAEVRISGTVVDKVSHARIKSASIIVPHTNISTVTNDDGFFVLKMKKQPEHIVVSSLGYKTQSVNIAKNKKEGLRVSLTPSTITLPELNVWQNDPKALVELAIERVRENFVQTREQQQLFYRETLQKGSRYIDIAEAILSTCKKGYGKDIRSDRLKVMHGRHIVSQRKQDTLSVRVQGGPTTAINYDAVKNPELLFLDIKDGCYSFSMEIPEEMDDRTQIVIAFRPQRTMEWPLYSGKMYLDRQSLAFTRIEMSLDMTDQGKVTRMLLVKKPAGLRFKPLQLTTVMNYRNGRISYMKTSLQFKCDWKRRLFSRSYTSCSEMVVTDFESNYQGPDIEYKERFDDDDDLQHAIDSFSDPDFWKDYNIIEPTVTLEKAILKLKKS